MRKNTFALIIVLLIIFFGFGFWFGYFYGQQAAQPRMTKAKENKDDTFEAGWQAAKENLSNESKVIIPHKQIHVLSGEVSNLGNRGFSLTTTYVSDNPLAEPAPPERTVLITDKTQFIERVILSADEFRVAQQKYTADLREYRDAVAKGEEGRTPPKPLQRYIDHNVDSVDLQKGDEVRVMNNSSDIEYKKEFEAEFVYIIKQH